MTTLNLPLQLDDEALAAIDRRRGSGSREELMQLIISAEVSRFIQSDFDAAVNRLTEAARILTYEQRTALIASVEAQLTP
jgi:hypothetical protein